MKDDYRDICFDTGLVCYNTNNNAYCVVLNGKRGNEDDREALVLEFCAERGFMLHTPPNRALRPTGKIVNLRALKKALEEFIV